MPLGEFERDRRVAAARDEAPRRRLGGQPVLAQPVRPRQPFDAVLAHQHIGRAAVAADHADRTGKRLEAPARRSEEHTSELQSLMRNSYAVFCLKKKKNTTHTIK